MFLSARQKHATTGQLI